jgi:hypothetical protein
VSDIELPAVEADSHASLDAADGEVRAGQLAAALTACRRALADHEAGLLSDSELRRTLVRVGLVCRTDEVWLLDLELGAWRRFDGVTLVDHRGAVRRHDVERWRLGLEALTNTTPRLP